MAACSLVTSFPGLVVPVPIRLERRHADAALKVFHCLAGRVSRLGSAGINPNEDTTHEKYNSNHDRGKQLAPFCKENVSMCFALQYSSLLRTSDPRSNAFSCHSRRIHCGLKSDRS